MLQIFCLTTTFVLVDFALSILMGEYYHPDKPVNIVLEELNIPVP
jgi:hypothetical protein